MDLKPEFPESLELSIQNPSRMLGETVSGSKAWCSAELSQEDWTIRLNEEAMKEFHIMAEKISNNPLPNLLRTHEEFEIPHLKETASSIRDVLDQGCGFCVMEQRPMETIPEPILVDCYWVFSQLIARPVAQKWDGTMIYDVVDTGLPFSYGVRGSYTNVELVFHNDNAFGISMPEYVCLLCKNPAMKGGISRFCSLYSVHNRMLEKHPQQLERLYRPMLFDRQKEHAEDAPETVSAPCFNWDGNQLKARVNVSLVHKGYAIAEREMDQELKDALECLEEVVHSEDLWVEAPLERGQIQFLNNLQLVHYRSRFMDHQDPSRKRHLYRIWLRNSGERNYDG